MKYTNTPATVFNAWKDPETGRTVYRPTVLRDVKWQGTRASGLTRTGISPGDAVASLTTVLIWPSRLASAQGRQYVEPKAYDRLGPAEVGRYWTLSDAEDRLARGAIAGPAVVETIQDITSVYDDVIKIGAVTDNRFGPPGMRHWYVAGSGA